MELKKVFVGDFETFGIEPRPQYPPKPVGVSILIPGRKPFYHAWGHPCANNSSKSAARDHIRQLYREGFVGIWHHAGFDLDVAETHMDIPWPAEHHDTLILNFQHDPRAPTFSLKPSAERLLGRKPTERDDLRDWIIANIPEARKNKKQWGKYIALAPGNLVAPYACADTTITLDLFRYFCKSVLSDGRQRGAYHRERRLTRVLVRMERRGVPTHVPRLKRDLPLFEKALRKTEAGLFRRLKVPKSKQEDFSWSGEGFANQLERANVVKEWIMTAPSKAHPFGSRSTGVDSLREVGVNEKLVAELEIRAQMQTCISTFMKPWLEMGSAHGGRFFARFNQVRQDYHGGNKLIGTETGRLSMTPNLQNVKRPDKGLDERIPPLRSYITPGFDLNGKKYKTGELIMVKRDYSQQELRILAHEEGAFAKDNAGILRDRSLTFDHTFLAQYLKDPTMDAHTVVQTMIQAVVQILMSRRQTKDLNFGLIYGMGVAKLALKLGVDSKQGRILYNAHMKALPVVKLFKEHLKALAEDNQPIYTWGGRKYFKEPSKLMGERWMDFWYKLLNIIVQGGAADCTKQAMVNYYESGADDKWPLVLQVHDELISLARATHAKQAHLAMRNAMLDVEFSIPMLSDGGISARSWADMKEVQW